MLRLVVLLLLLTASVSGQQTQTPPMPPSEAYQYATIPFNQARQQPNDLTDADKWALGISISRAVQACNAIPLQPLPTAGTELLAMSKLCILGQQFEPSRQALVAYLETPDAPERELALLLMTRTFLGLHAVSSAESQTESLLSQFPYDANIHYAIDLVIDAAQADSLDSQNADVVRRLNEQQLPLILKALHGSGSLTTSDKSATVSTELLFRDALRCASQMRADNKQKDADALVAELSSIASDAKYAQSSQLPAMQAALKRYGMVDTAIPEKTLHAKALSMNGALLPETILLLGKTTVLLPVTLWAPSSADAVTRIVAYYKAEHATVAVYAVTSFAANTGGEDKPSTEILPSLHAFRQSLPTTVPLLIVANDVLDSFAIDSYPSGVVIDKENKIRFVGPLATPGAVQLLEQASRR